MKNAIYIVIFICSCLLIKAVYEFMPYEKISHEKALEDITMFQILLSKGQTKFLDTYSEGMRKIKSDEALLETSVTGKSMPVSEKSKYSYKIMNKEAALQVEISSMFNEYKYTIRGNNISDLYRKKFSSTPLIASVLLFIIASLIWAIVAPRVLKR